MDDVDRRLEAAMCDYWWVPDHTTVVRRPEIEYLHSPRHQSQYNSVTRVQPGLGDYRPLVEEICAAHQGKKSAWGICAPSYSPELERSVLASGYEKPIELDAWSVGVDAKRPAMPDGIRIERVEDLRGIRDLTRLMDACFPGEPRSDDELEDLRMSASGPGARSRCYVAYDRDSGEPLATGSLHLFPRQGLGFLWGGCTLESARGRGLYSALVTARMNEARAHSLQRLGIFAVPHTSGRIVQGQGFQKHEPYHCWTKG